MKSIKYTMIDNELISLDIDSDIIQINKSTSSEVYTDIKKLISLYDDEYITENNFIENLKTVLSSSHITIGCLDKSLDFISKLSFFSIDNTDDGLYVYLHDSGPSLPLFLLNRFVYLLKNNYIAEFNSWRKFWTNCGIYLNDEDFIKILEIDNLSITEDGNLLFPFLMSDNTRSLYYKSFKLIRKILSLPVLNIDYNTIRITETDDGHILEDDHNKPNIQKYTTDLLKYILYNEECKINLSRIVSYENCNALYVIHLSHINVNSLNYDIDSERTVMINTQIPVDIMPKLKNNILYPCGLFTEISNDIDYTQKQPKKKLFNLKKKPENINKTLKYK